MTDKVTQPAPVDHDHKAATREANYLSTPGPDDYISPDLLNLARAYLALRAEVEALTEQLAERRRLFELLHQTNMATEVQAAALRKYARHIDDCQGWGGHRPTPNSEWIPNKCTCGLSAALEPRK